ncbi:MAG: VOC family protein [Nanoarchaeota archaeon]|nr:VOC family protein [Nanoarchaeota archaeon]
MGSNKPIYRLSVSDFENSFDFYTKIIMFKSKYKTKEPKSAVLSFEENRIIIEQANNYQDTGKTEPSLGEGITFQIKVKSIESVLKSLEGNKCPIYSKPEEVSYKRNGRLIGNKRFLIKDPDGYLLRFVEDL